MAVPAEYLLNLVCCSVQVCVYFIAGLDSGAGRVWYFILNLFMSLTVVVSRAVLSWLLGWKCYGLEGCQCSRNAKQGI